MAKKYKKRRFYRKKKSFRTKGRYRKRIGKLSTDVVPWVTAVADRTIVKLKYDFYDELTTTIGGNASIVFRANSVYDVEDAIGGRQPNGFDQWAAFYRRYLVHGCAIHLDIINGNNANSSAANFALFPTTDSLTYGGYDPVENAQYPYGKFGLLPNYGGRLRMKQYVTTAQMYGRPTYAINSDQRYSAVTTANPADIWYYVVQYRGADNGAIANVYMSCKLIFYVEFTDRDFFADDRSNNPAD